MATILAILIVYVWASISVYTLIGDWSYFNLQEFGMSFLWPFYPFMKWFGRL